ncbi:MAG: hypothetical protein U1E76_26305 [Planctomycetota bacterium]
MPAMHRVVSLLLLLAGGAVATSRTPVKSDASDAPAQLEKIKSLAGVWTGTGGHGEQALPIEVRYRVTAGGTAVEEIEFAGTDHEMVTLYHLDGDRLMLTHYCTAGNQPRMIAEPWTQEGDRSELRFAFRDATNLRSSDDGHMHAMVLKLATADRLESEWTFFAGGKPVEQARFELTRKKGGP